METGKMSRHFEAWKPVSGARVTGRIKMAETSVSDFKYFVVKMQSWAFVMRQVDTRDNLVGIFLGGLINRGKIKPSKKIRFTM